MVRLIQENLMALYTGMSVSFLQIDEYFDRGICDIIGIGSLVLRLVMVPYSRVHSRSGNRQCK